MIFIYLINQLKMNKNTELKISRKYIEFIKWRRCLILNNNNKEENQPEECLKIYKSYIKEIKKELYNKDNN